MKKTLSLILCVLLALSCATVAFGADGGKSFGAYDHVIIVGVDGAGAAFSKVESPCFDAIFGNFAFRHNAHTENVTISAQNWGSILTGVDYRTHGFTNTNLKLRARTSAAKNNSIFYYARQAMPEAELVSFNNWGAINHGIIETDIGVKKINNSIDPDLVGDIEAYLAEGNQPALMFVQLDSVDHAAHTHGGFSDEYFCAVRRADALVGRIYNAVLSAGLMENGLFLLVADHGESTHGHGASSKEESSAVLAAVGKTVRKTAMNANIHNRDVSAIALYALGIQQPEHFVTCVPTELFGKKERALPGAVAIPNGDFALADLDDNPPFGRRVTNFFEKAYHAVICWLIMQKEKFI